MRKGREKRCRKRKDIEERGRLKEKSSEMDEKQEKI